MGILRRRASVNGAVLHTAFFATALAVIFASAVWLWPHTAKADPHALYFTTVGQQQLFFNMLAALDQADYVEPATGVSSRQNLLELRDGVPGSSSAAPKSAEDRLESTKTNLPTVLTRGVTLEGYDLWTAEQAQLLAIESAQRNNLSKLQRQLCQQSLGRPACSDKIESAGGQAAKQEAFNADPLKSAQKRVALGTNVLESGTAHDKAKRQPDPATGKPKVLGILPYDSFVAEQTKQLAGPNNEYKSDAVQRIEAGVQNIGEDRVDPNIYNGLTINETGVTVSDTATLDELTGYLTGMVSAPNAALTTVIRAQGQVSAVEAAKHDAVLAATKTLPIDPNSTQQTVREVITSPAEGKEALLAAIGNAAANADLNVRYAPAEAERFPGKESLVDRNVAGATTTSPTSNGPQVAGVLDLTPGLRDTINQFYTNYAKEKQPLPADVNPNAPSDEEGTQAALKALTGDDYYDANPTCGLCVTADSIISGILAIIGELLCTLFGICFV